MNDTSPEILRIQAQLLAALPPWRKIQMMCDANRSARSLALAGLRSRHPEAGDAEIQRRLRHLMLGPDLAVKAYGSA